MMLTTHIMNVYLPELITLSPFFLPKMMAAIPHAAILHFCMPFLLPVAACFVNVSYRCQVKR
jgi:hypothetical protein